MNNDNSNEHDEYPSELKFQGAAYSILGNSLFFLGLTIAIVHNFEFFTSHPGHDLAGYFKGNAADLVSKSADLIDAIPCKALVGFTSLIIGGFIKIENNNGPLFE